MQRSRLRGFVPPGSPHARPSTRRPRGAAWTARLLAVGMVLGLTLPLPGAGTARAAGDYVLLSSSRLLSLPTSGGAWDRMVSVARGAWDGRDLQNQNSKNGVQALAAALVFARTGDSAMRDKARDAVMGAIGTWQPITTNGALSIGRQLPAYVMVADLVELSGGDESAFRSFLGSMLTQRLGTHARWYSLRSTHEDSDNNWGGWAGAARIAAAIYLGNSGELAQAERVYRGFLGDRGAYTGFRGQGSENSALNSAIRSWACDGSATSYVPTNSACGSGKSGAFPADVQRDLATYPNVGSSGSQYQSETTAGMVLQAELLYQNGYAGAWTSANNALARIAAFNRSIGAWNLGSVQHHWPWLINRRLGTNYPTVAAGYGRSLGYTDWLYGSGSSEGPASTPKPTPDPTPRPTATPRPTQTPRPTSTPRPTDTPEPTAPPDATAPSTASPTDPPHPGNGNGNGNANGNGNGNGGNSPDDREGSTPAPAAGPASSEDPGTTPGSPEPVSGEADPRTGAQPDPETPVSAPGQPNDGTPDDGGAPNGGAGTDAGAAKPDKDGAGDGPGDKDLGASPTNAVVGGTGLAATIALGLLIGAALALRFLLPSRRLPGS
jgi:Alginate lyase